MLTRSIASLLHGVLVLLVLDGSFTPVECIDPAYAINLTVFHVNPLPEGAVPINMDTGNSAGDMFFDMFDVIILPLQCAHPDPKHPDVQCQNQEAIAPDLVVNKVVLEVDSRYSGYALCNIGVNGTDGYGHACRDGEYCCWCPTEYYRHEVPCNATLGRQDVVESLGHVFQCREGYPAWACYKSNLEKKFGPANPAWWYSSLAKGYCGPDEDPESEDCTWRALSVEKVVNKTCHNNAFFGAVEAAGAECFKGCGPQATNSSDPCWVSCFYETTLGKGAAYAGGKVTGMPTQALVDAWEAPFNSDDPAKGGCPDVRNEHVPISPSASVPMYHQRLASFYESVSRMMYGADPLTGFEGSHVPIIEVE